MTASVAASASLSPFAQAAPSLAALGFHPIPLIAYDYMPHNGRGKCPGTFRSGGWQGMTKWQKFRDETLSGIELKVALAAPGANIGIVCGTQVGKDLHVVVLDFDATDPDALQALLAVAPASPMVKRGQKGESRFYLAPKTRKTRSYDGPDGRLLDVLTGFDTRQTVVPPSIHPDTRQPYSWTRGPVPAAELPVLTDEDMEAIEEALEQCGWSREGRSVVRQDRTPRPNTDIDPDSLWSEVKAAAMGNLSAWVPALDLYGCRPARGGYEAVATWRPSCSGRPIAERKLNLSIQTSGIKDFGTNDTYSAIDLVMSARDCGQPEATDWLRERLGLKDDSVVVALGVGSTVSTPQEDHDLPEPLRPKPSAPKIRENPANNLKTPDNTGFEVGAEMPSLTEPRRTRPPARVLDLSSWTSNRLTGEPPETRWLVRDAIPAAIPGMVAAQGDAGKSMVLLDLARRVAFGSSPLEGPCFGGMIEREGTCVVITAEDDAPAIHRRIANLDPSNARYSAKGERLIVVPLPDAGGPLPLVTMGRNGPEATDAYKRLEDQLAAIPDLQMVVLDPLQAFVLAPINEDPAAGQFACSMFATLAAETQANVMVAHHVRKSASERGQKQSMDLQGARELIRGTTALVDGLRWAYAFWPEAVAPARAACQRLGVEYQPNRVIMGGIVKANGPVRRRISTYVRNDVGLLVDQTMMLSEAPSDRQEQMTALAQVVEAAAKAGAPFTRHGQTGLDEQRHRLPPILQDLGRDKLRKVAEDALKRGLIVGCIAKGSTTAKWLDVPEGPIAQGVGEFTLGATPDAKAAA
ncbi:MAG: AAA family ATPase [Pseudomonadota bacterium]